MELSKRLWTVASAVTPGHRVADVGTDHGYIPIYLVKQGICPKAVAMDVNAGPLTRAREHIKKEMLPDRIETRLGNGLENLSPQEADTVIIAGMGGDLICRILRAASSFFMSGKEFVLQPQSEWFKVRRLVHEYGYKIKKEWFLKEDGKYYVVIKAVPSPEKNGERYDSEFSYAYGEYLLKKKDPALLEYLQEEKKKKRNILMRMKKEEKEENTEKALKNRKKREERYKELEAEIAEMDEWVEKSFFIKIP